MFRRTLLLVMATVFLMCVSQSCAYRLNGITIPDELKTINVEYFENTAPFVVNNLSQKFTEGLKDRVRSQTRLSITRGEANASMSGSIVGYSIVPISVQATNSTTAPPIATGSRLTITVNVKYTVDPKVSRDSKKYDFEQPFSRYADFKGDIGNQEQGLIDIINKQLIDDIFNKAFNNW